ncbi:G patch domain-containing protein 4 [Mortierella sp. 14UC]|nr:G patch domain-containing protein 4 [Mortierella sp. 14UC]
MSFAEKQLAKFGWKSGDGLGKNKDGIKKSISVTKKNDTKGLGGKLDKWDFAWWDHVFNKSASNIQVNKDESGEVKVEKAAPSEIQTSRMGIISTSRPAGPSRSAMSASTDTSGTSTPTAMGSMTPRDDYADDTESKPAAPAKSGPSWLFGFVKASATSEVTEESKKTNKDFTTSAASFAARPGEGYDALKAAEGDAYKDYSVKVSDQELFEACEGRTARKGARSEQPGKLGRVTKELLVEDGSEKPLKSIKTAAKEKEKEKEKEKKDKKDNKEKKSKAEKKDKKQPKEKKEKKGKKDKSESKEAKEKKEKKEKKVKEEKKSKKRSADEDEPRPSKKSKKEKSA